MKTEIYQDLKKEGNNWIYSIKFSNNPYTMIYKGNILECQKKQTIIDNRIVAFFKKETDILITSDLNFEYVIVKNKYKVYDLITKTFIGKDYISKHRARNRADKLDLEYGAYRYIVKIKKV